MVSQDTRLGCVLAAALLVATLNRFVPPRYVSGDLPQNQVQAVGGGEVLLEASLDDRGMVSGLKTLRETAPFTEPTRAAAGGWRFTPAEEEVNGFLNPTAATHPLRPVNSKVLVAAVFRAPALNPPTFGEATKDVGSPTEEIPFPTTIVQPLYPPQAMFDGVVLVELGVGADGRVGEGRLIRSAPAFDQPALEAARQWRFRPGRRNGTPIETFAYVVFGFRQPVTVAHEN